MMQAVTVWVVWVAMQAVTMWVAVAGVDMLGLQAAT